MNKKKASEADEYFNIEAKEINQVDVAKSAHYTYRDGFRLGFGIFIGFLVGTMAVVLIIYGLQLIINAF